MSDLERLTAAEYLDGVKDRPLAELREMRADCQDHENAISYVRRLVHGRIDIVAAEVARRREGADPAALASLIDDLPSLLADRTPSQGMPRPPLDLEPNAAIADELLKAVDADLPAGGLATLPELDDAAVDQLALRLRANERALSHQRRQLHEVIDVLHAEIIRRYELGEASVDSLLT